MRHPAQIENRTSKTETRIPEPTIRSATDRDARDVAEIVRESYAGLPAAHVPADMPIFHEEHIRGRMDDPSQRWAVLSEQGRRVGVAMWRPAGYVAHLSMLFVRGDHHGRGYGAALLRHFERESAAESPETRIFTLECLHDSYWAIRFYKHHGYALYEIGDEGRVLDLVYWLDFCRTRGLHWPLAEHHVMLYKRASH